MYIILDYKLVALIDVLDKYTEEEISTKYQKEERDYRILDRLSDISLVFMMTLIMFIFYSFMTGTIGK